MSVTQECRPGLGNGPENGRQFRTVANMRRIDMNPAPGIRELNADLQNLDSQKLKFGFTEGALEWIVKHYDDHQLTGVTLKPAVKVRTYKEYCDSVDNHNYIPEDTQ